MHVLAAVVGCITVLGVLWEAFETVVLPRRVTRRFRVTRAFYRNTWVPWREVARRFRNLRRREGFLALYGPLSLLILLGLWAAGLILGFALLHWAAGSALVDSMIRGFAADLYFSGSTFFTLGLGDVRPVSAISRALGVVESGMGFGFLAMVISYLPVLYQSFSKREVNVSLLDARAGTPPTAAELIRRNAHQMRNLQAIFHEWEHWATELLESHISYPVLAYFRSQHDNQSWLAALAAILDATALCQVGIPNAPRRQAQLTFAMARHAVVDLAQVFNTPPQKPDQERLTPVRLQYLREQLDSASLHWEPDAGQALKLVALREMYEPYIFALAQHFLAELPPWSRPADAHDNWRTSRWGGSVAA